MSNGVGGDGVGQGGGGVGVGQGGGGVGVGQGVHFRVAVTVTHQG